MREAALRQVLPPALRLAAAPRADRAGPGAGARGGRRRGGGRSQVQVHLPAPHLRPLREGARVRHPQPALPLLALPPGLPRQLHPAHLQVPRVPPPLPRPRAPGAAASPRVGGRGGRGGRGRAAAGRRGGRGAGGGQGRWVGKRAGVGGRGMVGLEGESAAVRSPSAPNPPRNPFHTQPLNHPPGRGRVAGRRALRAAPAGQGAALPPPAQHLRRGQQQAAPLLPHPVRLSLANLLATCPQTH